MHEQPCVHYPEGVPRELPLCSETLVDMFSRSAQRFSRRPALYFFGKTVSYRECHDAGGAIRNRSCHLGNS